MKGFTSARICSRVLRGGKCCSPNSPSFAHIPSLFYSRSEYRGSHHDDTHHNAGNSGASLMTTSVLSLLRSQQALLSSGGGSSSSRIATNGLLTGQADGDVTTMDRRFQSMSVVVQQQQERRQAVRQHKTLKKEKSVATRRRVLMKILGMKRFYKTLSLVREVKAIREKLVLGCRAEHPTAATADGSATTTTTTNANTASTSSSSSSSSRKQKAVIICKVKFDCLPKSGRDLIARTYLVAAIEQTEIERLEKLPWDELILQAQKNLIAYREWLSMSETRE